MHIERGKIPLDGHIPEELIEKIRGSQDIVEVISRHVSLKKSGQNYVGLCPFHSEKTPSFMVSPTKQLFHCFGCGTGGNVITFLMKYENLSFPEAVRSLARDAGIEITAGYRRGGIKESSIYEVNKLASILYHEILCTAKEAEGARNYLSARGVTKVEIEKFQLGYSMNSWNYACEYLKKKGIGEEILEKAGIIIPKNSGNGYYDRFRGRIMFPIYDLYSRVVGFGGRVLDDTSPKYLNSPETPVFRKGSLLYGLDCAKDSIRELGYAILVEGYMDVIALHQAGITNVVGTLGTAFTRSHLGVLSRYCKEVVLNFDSDNAGIHAALRAIDTFSGSEVRARVLLLSEGEDPDSFIRKNGKMAFLDQIGKAKDLFEFAIGRIIEGSPVSSTGGGIGTKVTVAEECLTLIRKIPNRIEQDYHLERVARDLGIDKDLLYAELKRKEKRGVSFKDTKEPSRRSPGVEEMLLALIMREKDLREKGRNYLSREDFIDPQLQEVSYLILNSEKDIHEIIDKETQDQGIRDILTRLAMMDIHLDSPEKTFFDCIRVLQRKRLERELKEVEKELALAERNGQVERVHNLLSMQHRLLQKKRELYESPMLHKTIKGDENNVTLSH